MNDDLNPSTSPEAPELAALLREIRDRLPPAQPASRWQRMQDVVRIAEPWGILFAVIGLSFAFWAFWVEQAAREEDRINRAIGQFADGIGRIDALSVLLRNKVDLTALKAPGAVLRFATLSGANLLFADFSGAKLFFVDLSGAELSQANLSGATLVADLSDAMLFQANLSGANLTFANLSDANLFDANLDGANFGSANLSGATLSGANFGRANLSGANLNYADLSHAANLSEVTLCETIMPDGSRCDRDCEPSGVCPWVRLTPPPGAPVGPPAGPKAASPTGLTAPF